MCWPIQSGRAQLESVVMTIQLEIGQHLRMELEYYL